MDRITNNTIFFQINYKKNDKTISQLFSSIEKAEDKYYKIFKIKPKRYKILVCCSREEFDKHAGYKSQPWEHGLIKKRRLIMFSPLVRDKLVVTKLPKQMDFDTFFDHEINHIFYISYVGCNRPLWLSEGYATYMMNKNMIHFFRKDIDNIRKIENPKQFLVYRYIKDKFEKHNGEIYAIGTLLVAYLIENFGHEKIVSLVRAYKIKQNKKDFEREFKKIYGISLNNALKKAI